MDRHQLVFGTIFIVRDDLAELIVNEGVDVDTSMVEEIHTLLLSIFIDILPHIRPTAY